jgi:hypothetical protein
MSLELTLAMNDSICSSLVPEVLIKLCSLKLDANSSLVSLLVDQQQSIVIVYIPLWWLRHLTLEISPNRVKIHVDNRHFTRLY